MIHTKSNFKFTMEQKYRLNRLSHQQLGRIVRGTIKIHAFL